MASSSTPTSVSFGTAPTGEAVPLFSLVNAHGTEARITPYGGILTHLFVPDRHGNLSDVVLGFDSLEGYLSPAYQQANPYFGALIGRYANRIANGHFTLDGHTYQLAVNNGSNHLHGGTRGFNQVMWNATPHLAPDGSPALRLGYHSPHGEEGYPGTLHLEVEYVLCADNSLRIEYRASTDRATPLNLTQHSYFNLAHGQVPNALGHELTIPADRYTVVDDTLIPTGELRAVAGTPFDFREPTAIGARIAQVPGGYDHNWVLPAPLAPSGLHRAAFVYEPTSGRTLTVLTSQPGIQFYAGNFLDGSLVGKDNVPYTQHYGFCLETQHFPDSPNHPAFPGTILRPGQVFRSTTVYRFGVRAEA
ncbi:aldose epimerase family protein [Hymenobacter koreensis]